MIIRFAEQRDIPAIMNLLKQVNLIHHNGRPDLFKAATKYSKERLSELLKDENRPILVADEGGAVKGYAFCVLETHEGDQMLTDIKTLYLDDLCVDERERGKQIGTALYQAVLELARRTGRYHVTLNVWSLNEGARRFYEKCGMQPLKICMEQII